MPDRTRPDEQFLDLPADDGLAGEQIDDQVQRAQEQLVALKRQQEAIERQKRDLEELSRRQEQLQQGKAEMVEKFTRSLVVLERESFDAQKRVETLHGIHESFGQHLDILEAINPKAFDSLDMNKELIKSLSAVDDARAEYARALPKISAEKEDADETAPGGYRMDFGAEEAKDFTYWLKAGFAFTLPLFAVGIILVIVLVAIFNHP
jgi:hypothetical protein